MRSVDAEAGGNAFPRPSVPESLDGVVAGIGPAILNWPARRPPKLGACRLKCYQFLGVATTLTRTFRFPAPAELYETTVAPQPTALFLLASGADAHDSVLCLVEYRGDANLDSHCR